MLVPMGEEGLHAPEHRFEARRKHALQRFLGHILDRFIHQHGGIVDHRAQRPCIVTEGFGHAEIFLPPAQIAAIGMRFPARSADRIHHLMRGFDFDIGHADDRTLGGEMLRDPLAQAAPGAGDQDRLSREALARPGHHAIPNSLAV